MCCRLTTQKLRMIRRIFICNSNKQIRIEKRRYVLASNNIDHVDREIVRDPSDPCKGLDFENIIEDERFPVPSAPLDKGKINYCLKSFSKHNLVKDEAKEHGIDGNLFGDTFRSFKRNIFNEAKIDTDLYNILYELQNDIGHVDDLLPFFLSYAKRLYPVLNCVEDLRQISDFRGPPDMYPEARSLKRKIIFHSGPTNSGKTHKALQRFQEASSGIYCGPLRLLAAEIFQKTNANGVLCDLITGEERRWAVSEEEPSNHLACTVEVCSATREYECAVIDEIQMISEPERGFAWTKALLGLLAPEIHLCGEPTAINLVKQLADACGDDFEILHHERLTPLEITTSSLGGDFSKIERGDCIIAFSQKELYNIKKIVESTTKWKCAIVYGGLPPATKVDQAQRFNDPSDSCKVLIASDAVGMGLNLNIRRIVFSSMQKFDGKHMSTLSSSQVKQIGGRAGRYGTGYTTGYVTTLHEQDLVILKQLMPEKSKDIEEAGIAPTIDQVEMFSYQLPRASLTEIFETFLALSQVSGNYFICSLEKKMAIADIIANIPLTIRDRYTLCMSPADSRLPFMTVILVRFARAISACQVISAESLKRVTKWPRTKPHTLRSMQELEVLHDSFDLYLWLSYRYPEVFVDRDEIRKMQNELQILINSSISDLFSNNAKQKPKGHEKPWWEKNKKVSLTTQLLRNKTITQKQLKRLQQEWQELKTR